MIVSDSVPSWVPWFAGSIFNAQSMFIALLPLSYAPYLYLKRTEENYALRYELIIPNNSFIIDEVSYKLTLKGRWFLHIMDKYYYFPYGFYYYGENYLSLKDYINKATPKNNI